MERRAEERFEVQFEAKVTAKSQSAIGRVSNISESGISVDLPFQLTPGDPVQLDMADSTIFGQVVYSQPGEGSFRTGIQATRVALGSTSLSGFLQRVLMENMPSVPGIEPSSISIDA